MSARNDDLPLEGPPMATGTGAGVPQHAVLDGDLAALDGDLAAFLSTNSRGQSPSFSDLFPPVAGKVEPEISSSSYPPLSSAPQLLGHHTTSVSVPQLYALPNAPLADPWLSFSPQSAVLAGQHSTSSPDLQRLHSMPDQFSLHAAGPHSPDQCTAEEDDTANHKEKNRQAQRKFRLRQKEKMKSSQRQLEELTGQMSRLMQEKAELEKRNRILEQVVKLNTNHEERLHCDAQIMSREQEMLLQELAEFVNLVETRSDLTVQDAKTWTMEQLVDTIFPRYVERVKGLLARIKEGDAAAAKQLDALLSLRHEHEKRRALFSVFYWAVYSWNRELLQSAPPPPSPSTWGHILDALVLTRLQEDSMLSARRHLLTRLQQVATERSQALSIIGLELLQTDKDKWHSCPAVQRLQMNFGEERAAVFTFLFSVCDETLTLQQEAILDAAAYPWCPDVWQICSVLHARRGPGEQDAAPPAGLNVDVPALQSLLPLNTAFRFLTSPLLARGLGLRLKRGILMDPFETVVPATAFPTPSIEVLRKMSLFDVHCGRYREQMFWDWAKEHLPHYVQLPH